MFTSSLLLIGSNFCWNLILRSSNPLMRFSLGTSEKRVLDINDSCMTSMPSVTTESRVPITEKDEYLILLTDVKLQNIKTYESLKLF